MSSDLFVSSTGSEKAPALVFSHALGGDLTMWERQIAAFESGYRILSYDLQGHGRSPLNNSDLTIEDLGRDVLGLLRGHGIERAHFCGLSLGGLIGQWLGLHAPESLLTLTLVDTAPRTATPDVWNQRFASIKEDGMPAVSGATMERWFTENFRTQEPEAVARIRSVFEATSPEGYIACGKVVRDTTFSYEDLKKINVPTLVVTGSFDLSAKPEDCKTMAAHIAGSRYLELVAAHISPLEASSEFNSGLNTFLDSHRA